MEGETVHCPARILQFVRIDGPVHGLIDVVELRGGAEVQIVELVHPEGLRCHGGPGVIRVGVFHVVVLHPDMDVMINVGPSQGFGIDCVVSLVEGIPGEIDLMPIVHIKVMEGDDIADTVTTIHIRFTLPEGNMDGGRLCLAVVGNGGENPDDVAVGGVIIIEVYRRIQIGPGSFKGKFPEGLVIPEFGFVPALVRDSGDDLVRRITHVAGCIPFDPSGIQVGVPSSRGIQGDVLENVDHFQRVIIHIVNVVSDRKICPHASVVHDGGSETDYVAGNGRIVIGMKGWTDGPEIGFQLQDHDDGPGVMMNGIGGVVRDGERLAAEGDRGVPVPPGLSVLGLINGPGRGNGIETCVGIDGIDRNLHILRDTPGIGGPVEHHDIGDVVSVIRAVREVVGGGIHPDLRIRDGVPGLIPNDDVHQCTDVQDGLREERHGGVTGGTVVDINVLPGDIPAVHEGGIGRVPRTETLFPPDIRDPDVPVGIGGAVDEDRGASGHVYLLVNLGEGYALEEATVGGCFGKGDAYCGIVDGGVLDVVGDGACHHERGPQVDTTRIHIEHGHFRKDPGFRKILDETVPDEKRVVCNDAEGIVIRSGPVIMGTVVLECTPVKMNEAVAVDGTGGFPVGIEPDGPTVHDKGTRLRRWSFSADPEITFVDDEGSPHGEGNS